VSREPTNEPGTQRAQYYFGAAGAGIIDQLKPVSHQSVTLARGGSDGQMKPQVSDGLHQAQGQQDRFWAYRLSAPLAVPSVEVIGHHKLGELGPAGA
jgi:hypothetical protein